MPPPASPGSQRRDGEVSARLGRLLQAADRHDDEAPDGSPPARHRRAHLGGEGVPVGAVPPRPVWSRAGLAVLAAVGLVAIAVSVVMLLSSRAEVVAVSGAVEGRTSRQPAAIASGGARDSSMGRAGPTTSARQGPSVSAPVVVDVAGLVRHPGLVTLSPGARAGDAVAAAGGVRRGADLSLLNLATRLTDGQQVLVLPSGAPRAAAANPSSSGSAGPVDLNSATVDELDQLPGIGPVLAQRIVAWREANGRFAAVDELQEVSGIGAHLYAQLQPLVTV
ncbi:MAG: ComEA family DNA-binding protein [Actinomycetales bacterium]